MSTDAQQEAQDIVTSGQAILHALTPVLALVAPLQHLARTLSQALDLAQAVPALVAQIAVLEHEVAALETRKAVLTEAQRQERLTQLMPWPAAKERT